MQLDLNRLMLEDRELLMSGPDEEDGTGNLPKPKEPNESEGGSGGIQHDVLRRDDLDDQSARIDRDSELDDALLD